MARGGIRSYAMACGCVAAAGAVTALVLGAGPSQAAAGRAAAAASSAICKSATRPKLAARISRGILAALASRDSVVGLTVSDPRYDLTCALHEDEHFDSASAIKATIISALLYKVGGPSHMTKAQHALAWLMITQSDNDAATALWDEVGITWLQKFVTAAGMRQTVLDNDAWGLSQLTAHDEMILLGVLVSKGTVLSGASRSYVLWLMSNVISSQRWGVSAGAPAGVTVSLKNGWLPYPVSDDWHVNSIGAFRGDDILYRIVVLTSGNATMAYGVDTIQAAARVINTDIARA
ncbi:MAG TPA: serine hydrolase [Streptosporangiaceae bacterium]|nr:serine hydrolase [Streptosporangiaceae bacterium]